jgi:biopolymer transport protein ExbD
MSGSVSGEVKCEPNLTPMLDMVFQLVTFFVLIFNCKQAEMAEGVELPEIGSARPVGPSNEKFLVCNFKFKDSDPARKRASEPQLWFMGRVIEEKDIEAFAATEAHSSMLAAGMTEEDITVNSGLKTIVVIRADEAIPFRLIDSVITACQRYGFRQFAFKALDKKKKKETPAAVGQT